MAAMLRPVTQALATRRLGAVGRESRTGPAPTVRPLGAGYAPTGSPASASSIAWSLSWRSLSSPDMYSP